MSEDEKQTRVKKIKDSWSREKRSNQSKKLKDIWENKTDEEKNNQINRISLGYKNWIKNLSTEELHKINKKKSESMLKYYYSIHNKSKAYEPMIYKGDVK